MKWFPPNLDRKGRIIRACLGIVLLIGGVCLYRVALWACLAMIGASALVLFEAFRGWCVMRACGIKTKY